MIRNIVLILTFSLTLVNCSHNKTGFKKKLDHERPLPAAILDIYLKKIALPKIEDGVQHFEIRIWDPFNYIDSFPGSLERYYVLNGKLIGEFYLFSTKKGKVILTQEDMNEMQVEKFEVNNIPQRFLDSLIKNYNLSLLSSIDSNLLRKTMYTRLSTKTARYVFFEQASPKEYTGVFIPDPKEFAGLDKTLDSYAAFSKFTFDSLCLRDSDFRDWLDTRIQRIYH